METNTNNTSHVSDSYESMPTCYFTTRACLKQSNSLEVKFPSAAPQDEVQLQPSAMPSGCWQQTCTPIDTCEKKKNQSSQLQDMDARVLFFLVTTSLCQDQVICASAFTRISHSGKNCKNAVWNTCTFHDVYCSKPLTFHNG